MNSDNWLKTDPDIEYEDVIATVRNLAKSFYGKEKRNKLDRFRDFQEVFYGSDAGKRVLYEIIGWAGLFQPDTSDHGVIDVNRVMERVGQRKLLNMILTVLNTEPKLEETKGVVHNKKGAL